MSRKWFGKTVAVIAAVITVGCVGKIPGNPEAVVEKYIKAVQTDDFNTIYALNRVTARQVKYLAGKDSSVRADELKQNIERNKAIYYSVQPTFTPGIQWVERFFFTPSSTYVIDKAHWYQPVGTDPVNADYEKDSTVVVPVTVTYSNQQDAPVYQEKKTRTARYDCVLTKIRGEESVSVYSHDENWYFGGCIVDKSSIKEF